jgi:hypothetical protein
MLVRESCGCAVALQIDAQESLVLLRESCGCVVAPEIDAQGSLTLGSGSCGSAVAPAVEWVPWAAASALTSASTLRKVHSDCALGNLGICAQTCCNCSIGCRLLEVANVHDIALLYGLPFCGRCSIHRGLWGISCVAIHILIYFRAWCNCCGCHGCCSCRWRVPTESLHPN